MDIVEVNPVLDDDNRTAILAVDLVTTALGRNLFDYPKLNTAV
jgi:arginase family enzyme